LTSDFSSFNSATDLLIFSRLNSFVASFCTRNCNAQLHRGGFVLRRTRGSLSDSRQRRFPQMKAWGNAPGKSIIAVKQSAENAIHPGWVGVETRFQRWVLGFTDPGALPQASRLNAAPLAPNTSQEPRAT